MQMRDCLADYFLKLYRTYIPFRRSCCNSTRNAMAQGVAKVTDASQMVAIINFDANFVGRAL